MPKPIEDYISNTAADAVYRIAFKVWLGMLIVALLWNILIILPAILGEIGAQSMSGGIYNFFSYICHQMPDRSFYIHEHQFGVCSRCFGVYSGILLALLLYPLIRRPDDIEPFPRVWLILSCVPLAIDFSLTFFNIWENTFLSRFVTGVVLGVACAVYILPAIVEITINIWHKKPTNPN